MFEINSNFEREVASWRLPVNKRSRDQPKAVKVVPTYPHINVQAGVRFRSLVFYMLWYFRAASVLNVRRIVGLVAYKSRLRSKKQ